MDVNRVAEVGIAVRDLESATRLFVELLGAEKGDIVTVERYQMRYRMCRLGNVDFELMESTGEGGIIDRFLKSRGEGLHHIALKVSNLDLTLETLKEKGVKLIDREPQKLHEDKYAFVHPSSFCGVMFELIEGTNTNARFNK